MKIIADKLHQRVATAVSTLHYTSCMYTSVLLSSNLLSLFKSSVWHTQKSEQRLYFLNFTDLIGDPCGQ